MDWAEIGTQVILGIITIIGSVLSLVITFLINKYIKNDQVKTIVNSLHDLVKNCVNEIYQTYVEGLKKDGMFDKAAQEKALQMCLDKIINQMPSDVKKWLDQNYPDIQAYLKTLIESSIATLKIEQKKSQ